MSDAKEPFSWLKFIKGPFQATNYAKAIVTLVCMSIILTICYSVFVVIKSRFAKPKSSTVQSEHVGTNTGTINKCDSHDTENKEAKSYSLINLLCKN